MGRRHYRTAEAKRIRLAAARLLEDLANAEAVTLEDRVARARGVQALGSLWDSACERERILLGKPLPGSMRPAPESSRRRGRGASPGHAEPVARGHVTSHVTPPAGESATHAAREREPQHPPALAGEAQTREDAAPGSPQTTASVTPHEPA